MIQNTSFQKKVVYLGLIALLMLPLYLIGHPATGGRVPRPGGQLAQLRAEHDLAPAELGEIDPASESMKLATLGMRGVAANILWTKANHYKKTEDWEKLVAAVNQMAKLQPNFVSVWEFQSHNLSYNISVEHDDYKFRYLWVKKGIEFLLKGTRYNRKEAKLPWTVGWYTGQKFGRADEHRQFRVLFPEDQDFHNTLNEHVTVDDARGGRENKPDNWLTSRLWYNAAYTIVETGNAPIRGKAPHIFYTDGPKALMNYATAIESEGILGDIAEYAWREAGDAWERYGQRVVPHSTGIRFRLGDKREADEEALRLAEQLDELVPGMRDTVFEEKKALLLPEEAAALDKPFEELTDPSEQLHRFQAQRKTRVTHMEIAERAPDSVKAAAFRLAKETINKEIEAAKIAQYRDGVNYEYWQARCRIEQLPETVAAREDVYRAKEEMRQAKLVSARQLFEAAWQKWAGIFRDHGVLVNRLTEDDLVEDIYSYMKLLEQLDEELPNDFALQDMLDKFGGPLPERGQPAAPANSEVPDDDNPDGETAAESDKEMASEESSGEAKANEADSDSAAKPDEPAPAESPESERESTESKEDDAPAESPESEPEPAESNEDDAPAESPESKPEPAESNEDDAPAESPESKPEPAESNEDDAPAESPESKPEPAESNEDDASAESPESKPEPAESNEDDASAESPESEPEPAEDGV